jgi:hypothetical protein
MFLFSRLELMCFWSDITERRRDVLEAKKMKLIPRLKSAFSLKSIFKFSALILFGFGFPFLYLNCGKSGFKPNKAVQNSLGPDGSPIGGVGGKPVDFGIGKQDPNCMADTTSDYNGCVFFKNPLFQAGKVLNPPIVVNFGEISGTATPKPSPVGVNDQNAYLTYAVKTPTSGLDNSNFEFVEAVFGNTDDIFEYTPTTPTNGRYKFSTKGLPMLNLVSYSLYYWLNHFVLKIESQYGVAAFAKNKKVTALPHAYYVQYEEGGPYSLFDNAAWTGRAQNAMFFGVSEPRGKVNGFDVRAPLGLSAEIVAHEYGHANLEYAANLPINLSSNDKYCTTGSRNICSKTIQGSLFAIHEGVADVYAYLMFDSTIVGEDFVNSMEGLGHCNNPRSMKAIKTQNLKAQSFYDDCTMYQATGEVHAMGSIYATIWYGLIETARKESSTAYKDSIKFFYEHQKYISASDTFATLKTAMKDLDEEMFNGKFAPKINAEYTAMGF